MKLLRNGKNMTLLYYSSGVEAGVLFRCCDILENLGNVISFSSNLENNSSALLKISLKDASAFSFKSLNSRRK